MNERKFAQALGFAALATLAGDVLAQDRLIGNGRLQGVINDFTPASTTPAGPWLVSGDWKARIRNGSGNGGSTFFASLAMVRSDLWVTSTGADVDDTAARSPHVHQITLTNATVTQTATSITLSGNAEILLDGTPAAFSPAPVTVDISGGTSNTLTHVQVTFGGGATAHFGTPPIDGAVTLLEPGSARDRD